MGTAARVVRSRVDGALFANGGFRVAGVAGIAVFAEGARSVCRAAGRQRALVVAVLRLASRRACGGGGSAIAGAYRGNVPRFLASQPPGRRSAGAVSGVGELRVGTHLVGVAE